ncbi:MAG: hypothetical protein EBV65_06480 [Gammaproteobacteria bacterium]|nr:hypothetical protein [Gammaproteobacteria bacterium]
MSEVTRAAQQIAEVVGVLGAHLPIDARQIERSTHEIFGARQLALRPRDETREMHGGGPVGSGVQRCRHRRGGGLEFARRERAVRFGQKGGRTAWRRGARHAQTISGNDRHAA